MAEFLHNLLDQDLSIETKTQLIEDEINFKKAEYSSSDCIEIMQYAIFLLKFGPPPSHILGWTILNTLKTRRGQIKGVTYEHLLHAIFQKTPYSEIFWEKLNCRYIVVIYNEFASRSEPSELSTPTHVKLVNYLFDGSTPLTDMSHLLEFYDKQPDCIPAGLAMEGFCEVLMKVLYDYALPNKKSPYVIKNYVSDVRYIGQSLKRTFCEPYMNNDFMYTCLRVYYSWISNPVKYIDPPPAMASILFAMNPVEVAPKVLPELSTTGNPEALARAIDILCGFLLFFPQNNRISQWIVTFLNTLWHVEKYEVVHMVAKEKLASLFVLLTVPVLREGVKGVVLKLMRLIHGTPDVLYLIMQYIPLVFKQLWSENTTESSATLRALMEHIGMFMADNPNDQGTHFLRSKIQMNQLAVPGQHVGDWSEIPLARKTRVGLVNMDNTCYINSILQSLFMTKRLCSTILNLDIVRTNTVLRSLQELFALFLHGESSVLKPDTIVSLSRPEYFEDGHQQDCYEFLIHLFSLIEKEENEIKNLSITFLNVARVCSFRKKSDESCVAPFHKVLENPSEQLISDEEGAAIDSSVIVFPIKDTKLEKAIENCSTNDKEDGTVDESDKVFPVEDIEVENAKESCSTVSVKDGDTVDEMCNSDSILSIFKGKLCITIECVECHTKSSRTDIFTDLHLCFPDNVVLNNENISIQELINFYFAPEELKGENLYNCDNCKFLKTALKITEVADAPSHLIIILKIFGYDVVSQNRTKLQPNINCSRILEVPVVNSCRKQIENYQLYSFISHKGCSLDAGHYVASAQDESSSWFFFSDNIVSKCTFEGLMEKCDKHTPYILFYKKLGEDFQAAVENASVKNLKPHLASFISDTNQIYRARSRVNRNMYAQFIPKDDDNNDPPSSCGGGMGLGQSSTRFVF